MKHLIMLIIPILLCVSSQIYSSEGVHPGELRNCKSTREYITTVNFLREQKTLGASEKDILSMADTVSMGCTGAAQRFVKITNLLIQAELPANLALKTAQEISRKTDSVAENFSQIFAKIYLEKFFDLPANEALRMAKNLTLETERNPLKVREDFAALGEFCLARKGLDLSLFQCSALIEKIIHQGRDEEESLAKSFVTIFDFLTSDEKGPKLTLPKAIEEATNLLAFGPGAMENFTQAYAFAINTKGLGLTSPQSLEFARKLAGRTILQNGPTNNSGTKK